jgi:predicted ester cyclase
MNTESLKAVPRRFAECFDTGDWDGMRSVVSPSVKAYYAGAPGEQDFAAFVKMGEAFIAAFSRSRHVIMEQIAEGDRVLTRAEWSAVHTGPFNGIPPSNRPVKMDLLILDRVVDGKIVEHRGSFDLLGLLQQIGAVPAAA